MICMISVYCGDGDHDGCGSSVVVYLLGIVTVEKNATEVNCSLLKQT